MKSVVKSVLLLISMFSIISCQKEEVDIVSDRDINKTSFLNLFWNMFKGIITGDIL